MPSNTFAASAQLPHKPDTPALLENLQFADKPMQAVQGADALIIVTEWKAYRSPDWTALKAAMKAPVIFDGRNLFEPQAMREIGVEYVAIGRGSLRDMTSKVYSRDLFGQD